MCCGAQDVNIDAGRPPVVPDGLDTCTDCCVWCWEQSATCTLTRVSLCAVRCAVLFLNECMCLCFWHKAGL